MDKRLSFSGMEKGGGKREEGNCVERPPTIFFYGGGEGKPHLWEPFLGRQGGKRKKKRTLPTPKKHFPL